MGLAAHHRLATLRHWTRWPLSRAVAPRRPGQPNKASPHRSVTVGGVNPRGERLFGVDRPAVTVGADQSPRGESMRVRGRSGDGVGCAPPVGDTAPLDTVAIKPRRCPAPTRTAQQAFAAWSVTVGADQSPRGESMRARGRSGDGVGCAPPVGDTAPLDTVAIKPRRCPAPTRTAQQAFTASECDCRWGKSAGRTPIRRRPDRRGLSVRISHRAVNR